MAIELPPMDLTVTIRPPFGNLVSSLHAAESNVKRAEIERANVQKRLDEIDAYISVMALRVVEYTAAVETLNPGLKEQP